MSSKQTTWGTRLSIGVLSLLLLFGLYLGSYWVALRDDLRVNVWSLGVQPTYRWEWSDDSETLDISSYRFARTFFQPAHLIDKKIRRDRWSW